MTNCMTNLSPSVPRIRRGTNCKVVHVGKNRMSEMTSRRVHWFDVDVVGTMSIPSPGLDNVTAQAAVADDDDDDDDFALHPLLVSAQLAFCRKFRE